MRILIGPADSSTEHAIRSAFPDCEHQFLSFGGGAADVRWDPVNDDFGALLSRLPMAWQPEMVICCSPEYNPVPRGIEQANCLTVGIVGDWNLGGQAIQACGSMFDVLATDRNGCDRLRSLGFRNVVYVPFFSFDPKIHRRLEGVTRDLDIVMAGNFHGEIQRERAPWVARVASLSGRHRVAVTHGVYGDDYTLLMNRAKIVFNRSIRGEINMRAYEAAACGTLLFYERENREIRDLFEDRVECVLYGDDDLEDLLAYYLRRDSDRERIAEAAWRKLQEHTPAHKTVDIVRRVSGAIERGEVDLRQVRRFATLSDPDKSVRRARQWMIGADARILPTAVGELETAVQNRPDDSHLAAMYGCALYLCAVRGGAGEVSQRLNRQALVHLRRAVTLDPAFAPAHVNIGRILLSENVPDAARVHLEEAIRLLDSGERTTAHLDLPVIPRSFTAQDVAWEWACVNHVQGSKEWVAEADRILDWRAAEMLTQLSSSQGMLLDSLKWARRVADLAPDRGAARALHARALRSMGYAKEAAKEYRVAIDLSPLNFELRLALAQLLHDIGRNDDALSVLDDAQRIIDGSPCLSQFAEPIASLRREIRAANLLEPDTNPFRLLAFPDWNSDDWKPWLGAVCREFGSDDPVEIRFRVDPAWHPSVDRVVSEILQFAGEELGLGPEELPHITLMADAMPLEDLWKLFIPVNLLVSRPDSPENVIAEARGLPIIGLEDLAEARSLLRGAATPRSESIPCLST